jgi:hypothetical protein
LRIFLGFSDTGVNSGTAVIARRTGRRDRGVGKARMGAGLGEGGAGGIRGTRAGVREGDGDQDSERGQMSSAGQF